ncbi:hypothetical protein BJ912DRAFT_986504 [Pholiota molesta]|nr:hypothetical protein BJ912DRAFT_986504 [Pholiota molesta]
MQRRIPLTFHLCFWSFYYHRYLAFRSRLHRSHLWAFFVVAASTRTFFTSTYYLVYVYVYRIDCLK